MLRPVARGAAVPEDGTRPMPMGLQLTTPLFTERALLGYAHAYERATLHAEKLYDNVITKSSNDGDVTLTVGPAQGKGAPR